MSKFSFTVVILLLMPFLLMAQNDKNSGNDGLIVAIYPNYFKDIEMESW
ncbi:MAG: hypothetical protein HC831_18105 [Chloroflexia bacterium]|nr:hypothetical protein [Chloroflexia bacterium]